MPTNYSYNALQSLFAIISFITIIALFYFFNLESTYIHYHITSA